MLFIAYGSLNECLREVLRMKKAPANWEATVKRINRDQDVLYTSVTESGETALHIANKSAIEDFLLNMNNLDIMNKDEDGYEPLYTVSAQGYVRVVSAYNQEMEISRKDRDKPIQTDVAATLYLEDIVNYLCSSDFRARPIEERANIVTSCTASGLFDVALKMIVGDAELLITKDGNKETPLDVLVRMSPEFADENGKYFLNSVLSIMFNTKKVDMSNCGGLLIKAAKQGFLEFIVILLEHFPDLIWTIDSRDLSIFHIAASNKHVGIFNLIYEFDSDMSSLFTSIMDKDDNNMLHLAAKLAPKNELNKVSNAALQMQRELLWFKEVKAIVPPSYTNRKNNNGKTPQDIFSNEHDKAMVRAKTLMREMATALMVVSSLMASVAFSSAFTSPYPDNKTGIPNTPQISFIKLHFVFNRIALFLSTTSILACLSVLTSRYDQRDFLHALHIKLMIGSVAFFLSLWAMAVAFCSAVLVMYHRWLSWIHFLLGASLLLCLTIGLQQMRYAICSISDARNMFGSRNRLVWLQANGKKVE
jgi:hypothetical protein